MSERLPRGDSLVPLKHPALHISHCILFFTAFVQRSLLCFFSLTPALERACFAGREERGEHLRCGTSAEPLRSGASAKAHASGGESPASISQGLHAIKCLLRRCSTTIGTAWEAFVAAEPPWRAGLCLTPPPRAAAAVERSVVPARSAKMTDFAEKCVWQARKCEYTRA